MNILVALISGILLVNFVHCDNNRFEENITNRTDIEPDGLRFQRILHRKKRFLLFPPGSAIVVSEFMSMTFHSISFQFKRSI